MSPPPLLTVNAAQLIEQNLHNAKQLKASVATVDASEITSVAKHPDVWAKLLHTHITTLQTQSNIFEYMGQDEKLGDRELVGQVEVMLESTRTALKHARKFEKYAKRLRAEADRDGSEKKKEKTHLRATNGTLRTASVEESEEDEAPKVTHKQTNKQPTTSTASTPASGERKKKRPKAKLGKGPQINGATPTSNDQIKIPLFDFNATRSSSGLANMPPIKFVVPSIEATSSVAPAGTSPERKMKQPKSKLAKLQKGKMENSGSRRSYGEYQKELDALLAAEFSKPKSKSPNTSDISHISKRKSPDAMDLDSAQKKRPKIFPETPKKDKRKSDVSMPDVDIDVSIPVSKSKADTATPVSKTKRRKSNSPEVPLAYPNSGFTQEYEDISAEVDEKMKVHKKRLEKERKKAMGDLSVDKRKRESGDVAAFNVELQGKGTTPRDKETGASSHKKHKQKHEKHRKSDGTA